MTDIGGPLSHSSVVAREYGIPAVLGTAVATRRITDGERIHVDGDAGTVTLLDHDVSDAEPVAPSRRGRVVAAAAAAGLGVAWWVRRRHRPVGGWSERVTGWRAPHKHRGGRTRGTALVRSGGHVCGRREPGRGRRNAGGHAASAA